MEGGKISAYLLCKIHIFISVCLVLLDISFPVLPSYTLCLLVHHGLVHCSTICLPCLPLRQRQPTTTSCVCESNDNKNGNQIHSSVVKGACCTWHVPGPWERYQLVW